MASAARAVYDVVLATCSKLEERRREAREGTNFTPFQQKAYRCVNHFYYDILFAVLVSFNFLVIISQTDTDAKHEPSKWWVNAANPILLVFYLSDVVARLCLYRLAYFVDPMDFFDFTIVSLDTTFFLIELTGFSGMPSVSFLRICRLCRMRRILKMCPQLHKLGLSLIHALGSILWGMLILCLMVTCWSILAVQFIDPLNREVAEKGYYDGCIDCETAFSSVMRSNLTFFQQILAGDSWGQVSKPIILEHPWTALFFVSVWVSLGLAMTNLILAAIVESASAAGEAEINAIAQAKREEMHKAERDLLAMCKAMDDDASGSLTVSEIRRGCHENTDFVNLMTFLDIEDTDIDMIFEILDTDGSGSVSYQEFIAKMRQMRTQDAKTLLPFVKYYFDGIKKEVEKEIQSMRKEIMIHLAPGQASLQGSFDVPGGGAAELFQSRLSSSAPCSTKDPLSDKIPQAPVKVKEPKMLEPARRAPDELTDLSKSLEELSTRLQEAGLPSPWEQLPPSANTPAATDGLAGPVAGSDVGGGALGSGRESGGLQPLQLMGSRPSAEHPPAQLSARGAPTLGRENLLIATSPGDPGTHSRV